MSQRFNVKLVSHFTDPCVRSTVSETQRCLLARRYPKQSLCAYTTLAIEHYLDHTTQFREADRTGLLLFFVKPYRPVGKSTIGRWIKIVLASNGVDTSKFKPHSTRARSSCFKNERYNYYEQYTNAYWLVKRIKL